MRHEVMLKSNQQKLLHIIFITLSCFLMCYFFFFMVVGFICVSCVSLHEIFWNTLRIPERVFQAESFVSQRLCVDWRLPFC